MMLLVRVIGAAVVEVRRGESKPAGADWLADPPTPAGFPGTRLDFYTHSAGVISDLSQTEKDTILAAESAAADADLRDDSKVRIAELNAQNLLLRAVLIYLIGQIKTAVPTYSTPTKAQVIAAIRNIVDNKTAD